MKTKKTCILKEIPNKFAIGIGPGRRILKYNSNLTLKQIQGYHSYLHQIWELFTRNIREKL